MVRLFESPGRSVAPVERGKVERLLPCTEGALSVLADIREYIIINTFFMKASYSSKKELREIYCFSCYSSSCCHRWR